MESWQGLGREMKLREVFVLDCCRVMAGVLRYQIALFVTARKTFDLQDYLKGLASVAKLCCSLPTLLEIELSIRSPLRFGCWGAFLM